MRLAPPFVRQTAHLRSVEDYLAWLERRPPLERDHVMRPQSWYVTDLDSGAVLVRHLFLLGADNQALTDYLRGHGLGPLGWINRSQRKALDLTAEQRRRVAALYRQDFELIGRRQEIRMNWCQPV